MSEDWSRSEVEATVAEYFAMLRKEIGGIPYTKTLHNQNVQKLTGRSKGAVEFKFANISAVLVNHDQRYVRGYLPRQNYQGSLETAVLEWLEGANDLVEVVEASLDADLRGPSQVPAFHEVVTAPPDAAKAARPPQRPAARKIDFLQLDARNRRLGQLGEEFVVELERRRLLDEEKRRDLSRKVRWVSRDEGDGLGYDIASFEGSGLPRLIEVKTTTAGKYLPFMLSRNEVAVSKDRASEYQLYRVYDFGPLPRLYILRGALEASCLLTPTQFRATCRSNRGLAD